MNRDNSRGGLGDLDALMPPPKPSTPAPAPKPATPKPAVQTSRPPARRARPLLTARTHTKRTRSQVFYLPDDQIEALDRLSRQTERSKSDLVRELIAAFLDSSHPESEQS